jgi:hypothetical protein
MTSSHTTRLLVHARSLLRQSRCPECEASGMFPSDNCEWCKDRATTIADLLSHPTDDLGVTK